MIFNSLKEKIFYILEASESLVVSILVLLTIYVLIAFPVEVSGSSMSPNFETGDRLLIERLTKYVEDYQIGDTVVLHPPQADFIDYIKRVIALPKDTVKIFNCRVEIFRNGVKYELDEKVYLPDGVCTIGGRVVQDGRVYTLKENEYMVLGDNRNNSQDSRAFGFVTKDRIQGKVVARFWPFDKVKLY
jgi:signal peptidase I